MIPSGCASSTTSTPMDQSKNGKVTMASRDSNEHKARQSSKMNMRNQRHVRHTFVKGRLIFLLYNSQEG